MHLGRILRVLRPERKVKVLSCKHFRTVYIRRRRKKRKNLNPRDKSHTFFKEQALFIDDKIVVTKVKCVA